MSDPLTSTADCLVVEGILTTWEQENGEIVVDDVDLSRLIARAFGDGKTIDMQNYGPVRITIERLPSDE